MGTPVRVRIEVPRGSFVKRGDGGIEYLSPLPCPFNYGSIPDTIADDGDPGDAVVIGPAHRVGSVVETTAWLRARFVDDGCVDDKLICGESPPTPGDLFAIRIFFSAYAVARTLLNRARGRGGARFLGVASLPPAGR